jgi:hypothetical protein
MKAVTINISLNPELAEFARSDCRRKPGHQTKREEEETIMNT